MYQEPVIVLDFASMYPSLFRAHNLCFSTLLHDAEDAAALPPGSVTVAPKSMGTGPDGRPAWGQGGWARGGAAAAGCAGLVGRHCGLAVWSAGACAAGCSVHACLPTRAEADALASIA